MLQEKVVLNQDIVAIDNQLVKTSLKHRSIVAITTQNTLNKKHGGSGILLSKDLVLTVAHLCYNIDTRDYNQNIKVFAHNQDGFGVNPVEAQGFRFPNHYLIANTLNEKLKSDYALIRLKTPIIQDSFIKLHQVCDICLMNTNYQTQIDIIGYPVQGQNFKKSTNNKIHLTQYGCPMKNRITFADSLLGKMSYVISTKPGQSGSPVTIGNKIIGVHMGSAIENNLEQNYGSLINKDFISNIRKWCSQLNGSQFFIDDSLQCHHKHDFKKLELQKKQQVEQKKKFQMQVLLMKQKMRQIKKSYKIKEINSKYSKSNFQSINGFVLFVDSKGKIKHQTKQEAIGQFGWNLELTSGQRYFLKTHLYDGIFKLAMMEETGDLQTSYCAVVNGQEQFQLTYTESFYQDDKTSFQLTIRRVAEPRLYVACSEQGIIYTTLDLKSDCYWHQTI